jgi:two-component system response regulator GlrR
VFSRQETPIPAAIAERSREFLCWPCATPELAVRVQRFLGNADAAPDPDAGLLEEFAPLGLVGRAQPFVHALQRIRRLARCDAPVLIEGETGTGKELAARAIHYLGVRRDRPFIPINCGAIPENLVENELFGHERGAYTDARETQQGYVAQADGGTLFLDEIEALGSKAQAALLRFLQDHHYRPLGSRRLVHADVRIIAASNCDLESLVTTRQFRQDLMYRLKVMSLTMPALRDRTGDAEFLADHFLRLYCAQYDIGPVTLDLSTCRWLRSYAWPGNIRELENLMQRELLLAEGNVLRIESVGAPSERRRGQRDRRQCDVTGSMRVAKSRIIAEFERAFLRKLLVESGGNVSAAARRAGKERRAFGKLLAKYGINKHPS